VPKVLIAVASPHDVINRGPSMTESRKRILVAEDNLATLSVIRFTLEKAGFEVTAAPSGQAAWDLLERYDFDLLVSDFQMPGITGGELCQRIREHPRLAPMPVILLTAKGLDLDATRYRDQLSVSAIMAKPFSPRELTRTVQDCLAIGAVSA
jgi:CheY-like chemotaxis protein